MIRAYWIAFTAAALVLAGCVPARVTYYEPSASSGNIINNTCGTALAPADTILFQPKPVDLRITGSERYVTLNLRIPKGSVVKASSAEVSVIAGGRLKAFNLGEFIYYDKELRRSVRTPTLEPLVGANEHYIAGAAPRIFQTSLHLDGGWERYQIQLPALLVNDQLFSLPVITFIKKSGFGVFPLNC